MKKINLKINLKQYFTKESMSIWSRNWLLIIAGNFVLAFGTAVFLLPYGIITGGLSGIAIISTKLWGFQEELVITILTWSLFLLGVLFLGKRFAFKTLIATIVYPPFLILCSFMYEHISFLQLGEVTKIVANGLSVEQLLAALFGGTLVGVGCALTFLGGGSTGGIDIIALMGQKYLKIKTSVASFICDALIVVGGLMANQNHFGIALIGIMGAFASALMIDRLFLGAESSFVGYIVSSKWSEINEQIAKELERGTTLIKSQGGYTKTDTMMVTVAFNRKEYTILQELVGRIDKQAFITIVHANEVNGSGFSINPMVKKDRKGNDNGLI